MQKMMQHKINDRIKERRNINEFYREGGGVEGQKEI